MTHLKSGHATDVGRARDHNEDSYVARPELGLWVVSDGMGGHAAGEVASAIAVEVVAAQIEAGQDIETAIQAAHEAILQAGDEGRGESGMGCTIVALVSRELEYRVAWVGDSRAYLWDGDALTQVTRDHSYVQQLIDSGILTEEEARDHPQRSVISQALGIGARDGIRIDTVSGRWNRGQQILLCSDGLSGEVEDQEIAARLAAGEDLQETVAGLIRAANDNGGSDNITVTLLAAPEQAPQLAPKGGTVPFDAAALNRAVAGEKKNFFRPLVLLALFLVAILAGYFAFRSSEPQTPAAGGGSNSVVRIPDSVAPQAGSVSRPATTEVNSAQQQDEQTPAHVTTKPLATVDDAPSALENQPAGPATSDAELLREVEQVGAKRQPAPQEPAADKVPQLGQQRTPPKGDLPQGLNGK